MSGYDTERWGARRRPFDRLEAEVVRRGLKNGDDLEIINALRYVISFARLTDVRNRDGVDVDVGGVGEAHALQVREILDARLGDDGDGTNWGAVRALPDLLRRTRQARASTLEHLPIDRDSLEAEITIKQLAVVCGGGGGAGYVYPGVFELLERGGLIPDLMVGTSIGALLAMFRARVRRYDPVPQFSAAKRLSWSGVFRVLETESRYGLPATLRLYLRSAIGHLFVHPDTGQQMRMEDLEIPLYIIVTGLTVDALKHDLGYYESMLGADSGTSAMGRARGIVKSIRMVRDFLARPETLREIVVGRDAGTEGFDVLDAAGFSASIPGVIHYDVLRDDPRMTRLLDQLYAEYGVTRLGEGGMVANVGSRAAWESLVAGKINGRRNCFVLSLDCFAPSSRKPAWFPFQQAVHSANVVENNRYSDLYVPFPKTPSPLNLVPALRDLLQAMQWGRAAVEPEMPFIQTMLHPLTVMSDRE